MQIPFTKMHGLGNDFIVLDRVTHPEILVDKRIAELLWDRHFWVGCDQILIIEPSETLDFKYRIFNQDGSEVEMCGNGARCFFQYVRKKWLTNADEVSVETAKGKIILKTDGENIIVDMWAPILKDELISVTPNVRKVHAQERDFEFTPVSMGNPHAVIFLEKSLTDFPVERYGRPIELSLHIFPKKVNVEFINIISPTHIAMRVWERWAWETLACGTGACASVVAGILSRRLEKNQPIQVSLKGWDLFISWSGLENESVFMNGPAVTVFEGVYTMN